MSGQRRIDRALEPEYITDLDTIDLDELRLRRVDAEAVEGELSYYRRLLHGRIDLLAFERRRRTGEETRSLIEALPDILAADSAPPAEPASRFVSTLPGLPERWGARLLDRVLDDGIMSRLGSMDDAELESSMEHLKDMEREISDLRRQLHTVIDTLQLAIVERYKRDLSDSSTGT